MARTFSDTLSEAQAVELAMTALSEGRPTDGLAILAPFLERGSTDFRLWNVNGLILRQMDRREEAIDSLRRAAALAPKSHKIAYALARTAYEAGLPSVDYFGKALRLSPNDPDTVVGLATAFVADGEPQTAIAGLERIVRGSPHWTAGHAFLAKLRWMSGEREGFARSFEEALESVPDNLELRREHLVSLIQAEQWDEALRMIAEGRAALGENLIFAANEAAVYAEIGDDRAEALLDQFADTYDATIQVRRIRHYLRTARPELADEIITEWVRRPEGFMFWPYASVAWRLLDDPRWEWLEGQEQIVGIYDIADRLPPLDVLANTLRRLHTLSSQPLEQSLRGGTQTEGDIFTHVDPVLVQVREAIRTTVEEHVANLPARVEGHPLLGPPRSPIGFSGAWSVRLQEGGYHANHVHPRGWISSALYIVLPPDLGHGDAGVLTLGDPNSPTFRIDLAPSRIVEPKPGRLALFPSYMWHGTRPFGEGERITVAFDVAVPPGLAPAEPSQVQ